jgi:alpha-beta hydrolase superfamily lysophospholipase
MQILYLYGFASGPLSDKAQFFRKNFQLVPISLSIYDFIPTPQAFTTMRCSNIISNLIKHIHTIFHDTQLVIIGSSFGGFLAMWYTYLYPEKVDKLILMAPALNFSADFISATLGTTHSEWKQKNTILVEHYRFGGDIPLNYSFYTDLKANPPPDFSSSEFSVPTIIFHGINDEIVPIKWSQDFSEKNPIITLYSLEDDHQLLNQKEFMWKVIKSFLF